MQHQTDRYLQIHGIEALIKGKKETLRDRGLKEV